MIVRRADVDGPIAWQCSTCGDAGQISGWEGTPFDLSDPGRRSRGGVRQVRVPDQVAAALRELTLLDADAERVVYRARSNGAGDVTLTATDDELDELIGNLAAEANHESNRRRQQRLDAAIEVLDQAGQKTDGPGTVPGPDRQVAEPARPTGTPHTGLPDLDVARVQRWCTARVPEHARHQVRVECEVAASHLTIVERRAPWRGDLGPEWTSLPIARLRYTGPTRTWALFFRDRNLRFRAYNPLPTSPHLDELLTEIDRDPTRCFWG
jgi:hypothetical protein